ncbi:MAG: hypothetical protein ABSG64_11790 [Solirubrobacteraceae bacterium]|jgi:uncharacterized membrane protein YccC
MKRGNVIASVVVLVFGMAVLIHGLAVGASGTGAYHAGQVAGIAFGAVLAVAGAGGLWHELRQRHT